MIHVATVHFRDARWIEPQLKYLHRFLPKEHRTYAVLDGIDPPRHAAFDVVHEMGGDHADRLNALAEVIRPNAEPDDLLLFIDGDAFPIAPIGVETLGGTSLAAVRRSENLDEPQPHPCFALTTVGFWFEIDGDWRKGYSWQTPYGPVTDVGGNLLGSLREKGIAWRPLLRTNAVNLDPLWFAVYGGVVYHHGAGFRPKNARRVLLETDVRRERALAVTWFPPEVPLLRRAERYVRLKLANRRYNFQRSRAQRRAKRLSEKVFQWILDDDEFYRRFHPKPAATR